MQIRISLSRVCTALIFLFAGSIAFASAQLPEHAQGRLIVKFKQALTIDGNKTGIASIDALNEKYGVTAIIAINKDQRSIDDIKVRYPQRSKRAPVNSQLEESPSRNAYVLEMPANTPISKAAGEYSKDPAVVYAQPDYIVSIQ